MPFKTTRDLVPYSIERVQERYLADGRMEIDEVCQVDWSLKNQFLKAMLPDVSLGTTSIFGGDIELSTQLTFNQGVVIPVDGNFPTINRLYQRLPLNRLSPERHRENKRLFAVSAVLADNEGYPARDANTGNYLAATGPVDPVLNPGGIFSQAGQCRIIVTYAHLTYNPLPDDSVANDPTNSELCRYVTRVAAYSGRNLPLAGSTFQYHRPIRFGPLQQEWRDLPEPVPKTFNEVHWTYTWHMVPRPTLALKRFLGKVNQTTFDAGNTPSTAPVGTMLYLVPEISKPYFTVSGNQVVDISVHFLYRNYLLETGDAANPVIERCGHNHVFVPSLNTMVRAARTSGVTLAFLSDKDKPNTWDHNIFDYVELNNLFRFEGPPVGGNPYEPI